MLIFIGQYADIARAETERAIDDLLGQVMRVQFCCLVEVWGDVIDFVAFTFKLQQQIMLGGVP